MMLSRLVLIAAAAAGVAHYVKRRGVNPLSWSPRKRLSLAGGMGGAVPASSPVAETMWTPSEPAAPNAAQSTPGAVF